MIEKNYLSRVSLLYSDFYLSCLLLLYSSHSRSRSRCFYSGPLSVL